MDFMPPMEGNGLTLLRWGLQPVSNNALRACRVAGRWSFACNRSIRVTFCTRLMGLGSYMRGMVCILADCVDLVTLLQKICIELQPVY
jgi:hypothetical protein